MVNKYKEVSRIQRMCDPDKQHKVKITRLNVSAPVKKQKYVEELGRVVNYSENAQINNAETLSKFKVSDFCLENLEQIGYSLEYQQTLRRNQLGCIDNLEKSLSTLISNNE